MNKYDDYDKSDWLQRGYGEKYGRNREDRDQPKEDRFSDIGTAKQLNSLNDNARLYVTIRKSLDSVQEYKKLIMIIPGKISRKFAKFSEYENFHAQKEHRERVRRPLP